MYSIGITNTIDIAKVAAMSSQHLVQNQWYSWFKWTPRANGSPGENDSSGTSGSSCLNDAGGETGASGSTGPSGFPAHPELLILKEQLTLLVRGKCLFIQIFFHYINKTNIPVYLSF